jgi:hypothetical protein
MDRNVYVEVLLMRTHWLCVGLLITFLVACGESTTKPVSNGTSILGTLEIELTETGSSAVILKGTSVQTRGFVGDSAIQITSLISSGAVDSSTTRYIWSTFEFTNKTSLNFQNLTFYGYNQAANNTGGTAFKNVRNADNVAITDSAIARTIRGAHGMMLQNDTFVVNASEANYQVFRTCESADVEQSARNLSAILAADDVLEYGFVSRNLSGGRVIAPNTAGRVTIGFLVPKQANPANTPRRFTFMALLVDEPLARVTRSAEETTQNTLARTGTPVNAQEVMFVGSDIDEASAPIQTLRVNQFKSFTPLMADRTIEDRFQDYVDSNVSREYRCGVTSIAFVHSETEWNQGLTVYANGKVYSNRFAVSQAEETKLPTKQGDSIWQAPDGTIIVAPEGQSSVSPSSLPQPGTEVTTRTTTCSSGSGPFRRVRTPAGLDVANPSVPQQLLQYGYSQVQVAISDGTFTGDSGSLRYGNKLGVSETPYIYLGGSVAGTEVDAGIQPISGGRWAGIAFVNQRPVFFAQTNALLSDQINLSFEVIADGFAQLNVNGLKKDFSAAGFKKDGRRNRLKRLQTIAQANSSTKQKILDIRTGAFFSADWLSYNIGRTRLPSGSIQNLRPWNLAANIAEDCVAPSATVVHLQGLSDRAEEITITLQ